MVVYGQRIVYYLVRFQKDVDDILDRSKFYDAKKGGGISLVIAILQEDFNSKKAKDYKKKIKACIIYSLFSLLLAIVVGFIAAWFNPHLLG